MANGCLRFLGDKSLLFFPSRTSRRARDGSAEDLARCARIVWDFDRIMFYKACETEPTTPFEMIGLVGHELEKVQAEEEASKMALHTPSRRLCAQSGKPLPIRSTAEKPYVSWTTYRSF
jgi:hypothetical protein